MPNPSRWALVPWLDDTPWPLFGIQWLAISLVGENDLAVREIGIELCQRKHHLVAVGSFDQQNLHHLRPLHFADLDACEL